MKAESAAICLQSDLLMLGKNIYTNVSYPQQLEYIQSAGADTLILLFSYTGTYFAYADRQADEEHPLSAEDRPDYRNRGGGPILYRPGGAV